VDAIQVAASVVTALQTIRSRHSDAQEPLVVTVGMIKGGLRENIIADKVEMAGTVRTASAAMQKRAAAMLKQIAEKTAEAHGAKAEVNYREGYPAVINDAALVRRMLPVLREVTGESSVIDSQPGMGGEDFAYFAQKVPGFYLRLGVARPGVEKPAGAHTPEFEIDEMALLTGVRTMSALVLESLITPVEK
jgi:amidohydrolase